IRDHAGSSSTGGSSTGGSSTGGSSTGGSSTGGSSTGGSSTGGSSTGGKGGGSSTLISMLSDADCPLESMTIRSTLYVPATSNMCSTVSSSSTSTLPSPKSQ